MTAHEESTAILKEEIQNLTQSLEAGSEVLVRGGYTAYTNKDRILYRNCETIVQKLVSLGYDYTTNHGYGCRDYHFTKRIEL